MLGIGSTVNPTYEFQSEDKRRKSFQSTQAYPTWSEEIHVNPTLQENSASCPDHIFGAGPVPQSSIYRTQTLSNSPSCSGRTASQPTCSGRPVLQCQFYQPQDQFYPPQQGQFYPPQQGQFYPPQQGQFYPPQQGQFYPPQQGQFYPPRQGQFYSPKGQFYPPQSQPSITPHFPPPCLLPGNVQYEQQSPAHSPPSSPTDPLANMVIYHPSYWEFQRRGEDEMAKFFHLVIEHASQLDTEKLPNGLNYEDPSSKKTHKNAKQAIGTASLDFRWQMKHLEHNLAFYSKYVFRGTIKADELKKQCEKLKRKADDMAHKQHLYRAEQSTGVQNGGGVLDSIHDFFQSGIKLVEQVLHVLNSKISGLTAHASNLQGIYATFKQIIQYRFTYRNNKRAFQAMNPEQRRHNSRVILDQLNDLCKTSKDCCHMVAVEFASHCDQDITAHRSRCAEEPVHLEWKRAGGELNPLGAILMVQDNVVGQSEYEMDPFCPSNIEIQQRGENKMALFFREVMGYAIRQGLPIKYKDLESKGILITAKEALERPCSFDFRSLMDHLFDHSSVYTKDVFRNILKKTDIEVYCSQLKSMAQGLAHKSHLKSRYAYKGQSVTSGAGTMATLSKFFEYGVSLVDDVFKALAHVEELQKHQDELQKHRHELQKHRDELQKHRDKLQKQQDGLHKISSALGDYVKYRRLHRKNMSAYREMNHAEQEQVSRSLIEFLKADDQQQYEPLIIVEFTARLDWEVDKLLTKSPETISTPTAPKLTRNRFESLSNDDPFNDEN